MLSEVLRYIEACDGAAVTAIRARFDLPPALAANLCIQLQDAGFVADHEIEPCHHKGAGPASGESAACHGQEGAAEFGHGCCGLNAPYRITPAGRAYLAALGGAS